MFFSLVGCRLDLSDFEIEYYILVATNYVALIQQAAVQV